MWRTYHIRAKIEKCRYATEWNNASSNTLSVCIEDKLRHTQSWREQSETSVEDKLKEDRVGPRTITPVCVYIYIYICQEFIKQKQN